MGLTDKLHQLNTDIVNFIAIILENLFLPSSC